MKKRYFGVKFDAAQTRFFPLTRRSAGEASGKEREKWGEEQRNNGGCAGKFFPDFGRSSRVGTKSKGDADDAYPAYSPDSCKTRGTEGEERTKKRGEVAEKKLFKLKKTFPRWKGR